MSDIHHSAAFVRHEQIPEAPPPPGETGAALVQGEMRVTHLGRSAWEFTNCWDLTTTPNTLILGTGSLTGANGDQVFYTQTVASFVGADFVMDWVIDGGTGRFEGATGNASLSGTTTDLATLCCGDGRLDGKISSVGSTH